MSTDPTVDPVGTVSTVDPIVTADTFDLDAAWTVHEQVSIRPERFGALLYHFGTRRLSFLKSPELLRVVNRLAEASSAREACTDSGVPAGQVAQYRAALATLAASQMIRRRSAA